MFDIPLELATCEQIANELHSRRAEFVLICLDKRATEFGGLAVRSNRPIELLRQAAEYISQFRQEGN